MRFTKCLNFFCFAEKTSKKLLKGEVSPYDAHFVHHFVAHLFAVPPLRGMSSICIPKAKKCPANERSEGVPSSVINTDTRGEAAYSQRRRGTPLLKKSFDFAQEASKNAELVEAFPPMALALWARCYPLQKMSPLRGSLHSMYCHLSKSLNSLLFVIQCLQIN